MSADQLSMFADNLGMVVEVGAPPGRGGEFSGPAGSPPGVGDEFSAVPSASAPAEEGLTWLEASKRGLCVKHQDRAGSPWPRDWVCFCEECKRDQQAIMDGARSG